MLAVVVATSLLLAFAQHYLPDAVWRYVEIDCSSAAHGGPEGDSCRDNCKPCRGSPEEINRCLRDAGLLHCEFGFFALVVRHMDMCERDNHQWILFEDSDYQALQLSQARSLSLWFFNRTEVPEDCWNSRPEVASITLPSNYKTHRNLQTSSCAVDPRSSYPTLHWRSVPTEVTQRISGSIAVNFPPELTKTLIGGLRPPVALAFRVEHCNIDLVKLPGEGYAVEVGSWVPFSPRSWKAGSFARYSPSLLVAAIVMVPVLVTTA